MRLIPTATRDKSSSGATTVRIPALAPTMRALPWRMLIYDLETYATGFADPQWVPQVITCAAWKWYGAPDIKVEASIDYADHNTMPHLQPDAIRAMLEPFLADLAEADAVITYNGARFDNPVLNGSMWYVGLPPLGEVLTYDLHRFGKTKGLKKGLDNVAIHLGAAEKKLSMNHAEWTEGYLEPGWKTIKERAVSDVVLTEQVFDLKQEAGWLKPPQLWKP